MSFLDLIKKRETFSEKGQGALEARVKVLQGALYSALLDKIIAALETDEAGAIKFTISNLRTSAKLGLVWSAHQKDTNRLTKWIVEQLLKLFGLNTLYAREVATVTDSLEARALKLLMFNLGYDLDTKAVIKDSWLANLGAQDSVRQRIANRIGTAIQSNISLKQFQKDFRDDFLNSKTGLGYLERYYNQNTFDLFQRFDRSTQEVYRQELKLEFALYSGTIMQPVPGGTKGTRPFCWQRVNNLYDLKTIDGWNQLEWSGKNEFVDVKIAAGGHQCRHHLSWVSKEMAETLQKRGRKLNNFNPPKPKNTK